MLDRLINIDEYDEEKRKSLIAFKNFTITLFLITFIILVIVYLYYN